MCSEYQQNLKGRKVGVILVGASTNRLVDLLPLVPEVLRVMESSSLAFPQELLLDPGGYIGGGVGTAP